MDKEFQKYATKGLGLSSMTLDRYRTATDAYINPTIIEERKLNVASMDVFSRLMMDRIIFLGAPITDDVANIIQAQLLYLEAADSSKVLKAGDSARYAVDVQHAIRNTGKGLAKALLVVEYLS